MCVTPNIICFNFSTSSNIVMILSEVFAFLFFWLDAIWSSRWRHLVSGASAGRAVVRVVADIN